MSSVITSGAITSSCGLLLVCLAAILSPVSCRLVIGRGECPVTDTQLNFDLSRYLGTWYEYSRFDNPFELGVKCGTAQYDVIDPQTVRVVNGGIREFKILGRVINRQRTSVNGTATVVDQTRPAELNVKFSQFDPSTSANYYVVDTDYNNYAVVFSCSQLPLLANLNIQYLWILTRQPASPPANLSAILDNLTTSGVDVSKLKLQSQTDCVL